MSQQQKLEKVLDLLLSESQDKAAELLHQIIVDKARTIYESIVDEETDDLDNLGEAEEVGGDASNDFTSEIAADEDEVAADQENGGEASDDDADDTDDADADDTDGFSAETDESSTEDRVEDLESQLAELRAEFDALMGEELQEPEHADLASEFDTDVTPADDADVGADLPDFGSEDKVVGEVIASMFEKKKSDKLEVAPQAKDKKKDKKVDEETQFLSKVADTGQRGTAKLVGTGKGATLGAEQNKSPYTNVPARKDYGGKPVKIGGGTGGEYGKYSNTSVSDETITDNVNVDPKKNTAKGNPTGSTPGNTKSPFSKKPG